MKPDEVAENIIRMPKEKSAACNSLQNYNKGDHLFLVTLPMCECVFNNLLVIDLFCLKGNSELHILYTRTNSYQFFCTKKSLSKQSAAPSLSFELPYTVRGYTGKFRLDQDSMFTGCKFKTLSDSADIQIQLSCVESHNALKQNRERDFIIPAAHLRPHSRGCARPQRQYRPSKCR